MRHRLVPYFVIDNIERLHELRCSKGLTADKLGEYVGISERTLRDYEKANRRPIPSHYNKLAELFGWQKW